MAEAQLQEVLHAAGDLLRYADAVLVVSEPRPGSFCSAVSSTSPGPARAEICQPLCPPSLFETDPELAWGLWLSHYRDCQQPEESYNLVQALASRAALGSFVTDAGVESRWLRSGWPQDRIWEVGGSLRRLQCSDAACQEEPWDAPEPLGLVEDPPTHRAVGDLPLCGRCGSVARPCVRMSADDTGFSESDSKQGEDAFGTFMTRLSGFGDSGASAVVLYLPGEEDEVSPGLLGKLELYSSWGIRLVRAGPKEQPNFPQKLAEKSLWVRLPMHEALTRLNDYISSCDMACFVVFDPEGNGAEVLAPADSTMGQILRRVSAELDWDSRQAPDGEPQMALVDFIVASSPGGPGAERVKQLGFDEPVPKNFFAFARDDVPTAKLRICGLRWNRQSTRLQSRFNGVRALLLDLIKAFRSEEYDARLQTCGDQIDVRDLVKEVHLTVLPQHGFNLTRDMAFKETFQVQSRMQTFINSALDWAQMAQESMVSEQHQVSTKDIEDVDLGVLARYSLVVSGVAKLASLPARRKGRTKAQTMAPLVLKVFSMETAVAALPPGSKPFRNSDAKSSVLYGGWLGSRRAPTAFLEAPSEEIAYYLRDDPDGPFASVFNTSQPENTMSEYDVTAEDIEHWHRWGFTVDAHERIMKADWHTLPGVGDEAKLFIPRLGKPGALRRAPRRCMAFAEAFRLANVRCWSALVQALQDVQVKREMEHDHIWTVRGSRLVGSLIRCLSERGQFGVMECQVWWGNRLLQLPSHKDGATSLLHLGVTLGGTRTVRVGVFDSCGWRDNPPAVEGFRPMNDDDDDPPPDEKENVWDDFLWSKLGAAQNGSRKDFSQQVGSMYLSAPYNFEHGVRFDPSTKQQPIMSLQCRFAFEPALGKEMNRLRDHVMWDICNTIAETLSRMSAQGHLRMPSIEEVIQAEHDLALSEEK